MKILKFLFFVIASILYGQKDFTEEKKYDYEIVYNYYYVKDTLNVEDKRTEKFILYADKINNSYFLPTKLLEIDSLLLEVEKTNQLIKLPSSYSKWRVLKRVDSDSFFIDMLGKANHKYLINNDMQFSWNITNEEKEILGYKVVKATAKAYGRLWEAWFTHEIPLDNGPYKFSGLPGLILKINDSQNYFLFDIVSIKSKDNKLVYSDKILNAQKIQKKDFIRSSRNYSENIIEELKQQGIRVNEKTQGMVLENVKRNNNFIEKY